MSKVVQEVSRDGLSCIDFDDENRCPGMWELVNVRAFCFLSLASMTIVFTTSTEYTRLLEIDNPVFPGLMIGLVPLMAGIGSFGWQYVIKVAGFKKTFASVSVVGCVGSVLYALALVMKSPAALFLSRVLIGLSGPTNLYLEHHAVSIGKKKIKEHISTIWAIGTLGLGFGPIASATIGYIFGDLLGLYPQTHLVFNTVTIPGWFMACLYLTQVLIFQFRFEAPTTQEHAVYRELQRNRMPSNEKEAVHSSMIDVVVLGSLLLCVFAAGVGVSGIETRTAFVAQAQNENHTSDAIAWSWNANWTGLYLGLFFSIFAGGSYIYGKCMNKIRLSQRCWIMVNLSAVLLSCVMLFDYSGLAPSGTIALWSVGFLMFGFFIMNYRVDVISMAMQRCPNHWISTYSAMVTLCNSVGRATGPMAATYIGSGYMHQSVFSSILVGIFGGTALMLGILYKQLEPIR
mmetsp:Transcript_8161/g.13169  ORF Transcript_8161/g.13169 Transcript_8161/m.13169 type:complete len:458 (-) Transcript_8161:47-1420(-)